VSAIAVWVGLSGPPVVHYLRWGRGIVSGNLGRSLFRAESAGGTVDPRLRDAVQATNS
jgi:hypothetical protein